MSEESCLGLLDADINLAVWVLVWTVQGTLRQGGDATRDFEVSLQNVIHRKHIGEKLVCSHTGKKNNPL